jgi:phosphoribosylamine--glycine ligase
MKVLVIGGGGREHALAWRLAACPKVQCVFVAPGNAGTAGEEGVTNVDINSVDEWVDFARRETIGLTVVGPEAPLAAGVVDAFRAAGLRVFGPTAAAARLESSKEFAKAFMQRHNIPTAPYAVFDDPEPAHRYVDQVGAPIVVKADGLAAGKGVVVATDVAEAHAAIDRFLVSRALGAAGARVVIEGFLAGEEASFIVMVDGEHVVALATSQDHKRLGDGDVGPNTGGMGAYSPAPVITPQLHARVMREVIHPTVAGLAAEGTPFTGFLYAGLMIGADGTPKVLEFNCRLGDPETQPILMRLKTDLVELIELALAGRLDTAEPLWDRRVAVGVVMAAAGYPDAPRAGDLITGLPAAQPGSQPDCRVFHAGTRLAGRDVVTSGGRVLCVTALGDTIRAAQRRAYEVVDQIRFDGAQTRRDIGHRAAARAPARPG